MATWPTEIDAYLATNFPEAALDALFGEDLPPANSPPSTNSAHRPPIAEGLRLLHRQWVADGASAGRIGHAVSNVFDALTRRLLTLAEARLGPPPLPYAWVATGSQGRQELTIHSDQDNALILDDAYRDAAHAPYFAQLARFVCDGLNARGQRHCPGGVMASNPLWCQPLAGWQANFARWAARASRKAAMLAANFSDMRVVAGDARLLAALRRESTAALRRAEPFLARLAANALDNRPPLGFFGNFTLAHGGAQAGTLDLKSGGLIPIVDLARVHALDAGIADTTVGTVARLRAAAGTPELSHAGADALSAAFELIGTLRARHQAAQLARGEAPDNRLAPAMLDTGESEGLRDAFGTIATMQDALLLRHPHLATD